ncbi:hypothetical protein TNCV_3910021 [Trichonephila clavipes]|nr:hypothetical protein TNCV_3910021 [Trichonephila clavipes]
MNGVMAFLAEISQMHISQLTGALAKTKVFHEVLKLPINDHSKYLIKVVTLASSPARLSMPGVLATRGLLATDNAILNHGQVTWTTPELAPPSPTTPH